MKPKLLAILFSIPFISLTSTGALAADSPDYAAIVQSAYQKFKNDNRGKVADYIPALAAYSDKNYAIAIATIDGKLYTAGDTQKNISTGIINQNILFIYRIKSTWRRQSTE